MVSRKNEPKDSYRPMAAQEITMMDQIEALDARIFALERRIEKHETYHFGRKD